MPELSSSKPVASNPFPARRVLIADDNADAADTLAIMLEVQGNEVRVAHDGGSAVEIALTGWSQDEDRVRARDAGFDKHLVKPVDPRQLEELIRDVPVSVP